MSNRLSMAYIVNVVKLFFLLFDLNLINQSNENTFGYRQKSIGGLILTLGKPQFFPFFNILFISLKICLK